LYIEKKTSLMYLNTVGRMNGHTLT